MTTPWGVRLPDRGYGPGDCPPCVGWGTLSLGGRCQWCDGTGYITKEQLTEWALADMDNQHAAFVEYMKTLPGGDDALAYATVAMLKLDAENIVRAAKRKKV